MAEKALVNPRMLRWAREAAGYSIAEAAAHMKRQDSELLQWETGKTNPSIPQARKLAALYKRTLSVLYLAEPPAEAELPPDYRRGRTAPRAPELTPRIRWEVRRLHALRDAALDLADDDPDAFPPFPVSADLDKDSPGAVATRLRKALGISVDDQLHWRSAEKGWSHWRVAIEQTSCLVFVLDRLAADEFDGFSLAFDRAPVIAINGNRQLSYARRVFTLLHELAHVALRSEGICNLADRAGKAESFCNRTAAAILMPSEAFKQAAGAVARRGASWSDADLTQLASTFSVSLQAVYVRLVALELAEQSQYDTWVVARDRDRVVVPVRDKEEAGEGGPSFYNLYLHRMSFSYLRQVFASYHDDRLSLSELSDHLGVRPSTAVALDEAFLKRLRGRAS